MGPVQCVRPSPVAGFFPRARRWVRLAYGSDDGKRSEWGSREGDGRPRCRRHRPDRAGHRHDVRGPGRRQPLHRRIDDAQRWPPLCGGHPRGQRGGHGRGLGPGHRPSRRRHLHPRPRADQHDDRPGRGDPQRHPSAGGGRRHPGGRPPPPPGPRPARPGHLDRGRLRAHPQQCHDHRRRPARGAAGPRRAPADRVERAAEHRVGDRCGAGPGGAGPATGHRPGAGPGSPRRRGRHPRVRHPTPGPGR